MINKLKQIKFTKRGIYISLAISMLLIGGIGIYSSIRNMDKIIEDTDFVFDESKNPVDSLKKDITAIINNQEVSTPVIDEPAPVILKFVMPVEGEITKGFSNSELIYSQTMNDYRTHSGIDIISDEGSVVVSAEKGKITSINEDPLWGMTMEIEHENGYKTCYKNLSLDLPEGIETGSYVSAGGIIGTVGSTALVEIGENPHLHFEMSVNGSAVDPLEYIE